MSKESREKLAKPIDVLEEIFGVIALVIFVFASMANFDFIKKLLNYNDTVYKVIGWLQHYSGFLLIALVSFEVAIKSNVVFKIILFVLIAAAVVMQFFPGTYTAMCDKATALVGGGDKSIALILSCI